MPFDRLLTLLPCQSLEDFDLRQKEADAEQLLGAWSALWHPTLLFNAQKLPAWRPAASPPFEPEKSLIVVPDCCLNMLPDDWLTRTEAAGNCVLRNPRRRDEMVAAALQHFGENPPPVDENLANDFLALGFCHFQVELMTRKLRYMSNLDEAALETAALAAATAAVNGDADAARQHLQAAFDRLHEAREYFYGNETRLLDLTLVASSTLGEPLRAELAAGQSGQGRPCNLLISGATLDEMARREPATLDALRQALAAGTAAILGGEYDEWPTSPLGPEALAAELARGLACYEKHLNERPTVFGRRRFGLSPVLPQILRRFGFTAAFHCTLDDGQFPTGEQSRGQWEGFGGATVESLTALPIDAARSEPFLSLPETLGEGLNLAHTPTLVFAHWPGRSSVWLEAMRRIASYSNVLGEFMTAARYFAETSSNGPCDCFSADAYRSPYLRQDVSAGRGDPISRWSRYFQRRAACEACEALETCARLVRDEGRGAGDEDSARLAAGLAPRVAAPSVAASTADAIDASLAADAAANAALDKELESRVQKSLADFAKAITGKSQALHRGCLAVNPCSFPQAITRGGGASATSRPECGDVPSLGFMWFDPCETKTTATAMATTRKWFGFLKPKTEPPLGEKNLLRNEFCEIHFDPNTGAIRTIADYRHRDPRLAQQIALRLPHGDDPAAESNYSIMAADAIEVTSAGPTLGEMVCRGRLMDRDGRRLAGFRQTTRLWRGSRVVELLIELDIERQPGPNPWDSYYAARFAWKDAAAALHRGVGLANVPTESRQIESPHFIDIVGDRRHTTLLCGGLPYHRRFGRKLDTLLVVQGETARSFRLGIAMDEPSPTAAALGFLSPPLIASDQPSPPSPTGWLFHLDCRNVVATHWEPSSEGFRVRLLETDGREVPLGLRCFRAVSRARTIGGDGVTGELSVEGDRIVIPLKPHEWVEVEVSF